MGRGPGRGRLDAVKRDGKRQYQAVWMDAEGRRRKRNLGSNKAEAERLLTEIVSQRDKVRAGLASEVGLSSTFQELIDAHISQMQVRGRRASSVRAEKDNAENVARGLSVGTVGELRMTHVSEYQARRQRQGRANSSINKEVDAFRRSLDWGVKRGVLAHNPIQGYQKLPVTEDFRTKRRRPLTNDELARLFEAVDTMDKEAGGVPQLPLFRIALLTGAQRAELVQCNWEDVDPQEQTLEVAAATAKTHQSRLLYLGDAGMAELDRLREEVPEEGPLFRNRKGDRRVRKDFVSRLFARARERAEIPRVDAQGRSIDLHAMRTTYGSRGAEAGVELTTLQKLMGHATPITTATFYTKPAMRPLIQQAQRAGFFEDLEAPIRDQASGGCNLETPLEAP